MINIFALPVPKKFSNINSLVADSTYAITEWLENHMNSTSTNRYIDVCFDKYSISLISSDDSIIEEIRKQNKEPN